MAPVHLYLAAWVLGGVLLGASMLLDAREREHEDEPRGDGGSSALSASFGSRAEPRASTIRSTAALPARVHGVFWRCLRVLPLGLIGFGLTGLLAKGLNLDLWPWTLLIALGIGLGLIALGYRLSRSEAQPSAH
jgi:hypothetical protein